MRKKMRKTGDSAIQGGGLDRVAAAYEVGRTCVKVRKIASEEAGYFALESPSLGGSSRLRIGLNLDSRSVQSSAS